MVISGFKQVREKEGLTIETRIKEKNQSLEDIILKGGMELRPPWNKLFRAEFLRQSGVLFPVEANACVEDIIFNVELLMHRPRVSTVEMGGYRWICRDENSESSSYRPEMSKGLSMLRSAQLRLWTMVGCTEEEMKRRLLSYDYVNSYFLVCNLFKKGSPLTFKERVREVRRIVFESEGMEEAMQRKQCNTHTMFLKIYDFAYRFRSPFIMTLIFQMQYWAKYHMMPLYLKIVPRLRRW